MQEIIAAIVGLGLAILFILFLNYNSWERRELRAFNKFNNTEYSVDVWRVYRYEIKKLYPYSED